MEPLKNCKDLRRIDTLSKEITLSKLFYPSSENKSILKGKNLLPVEAVFSLLE